MRDILSKKGRAGPREKRYFPPESDNVDIYGVTPSIWLFTLNRGLLLFIVTPTPDRQTKEKRFSLPHIVIMLAILL